MSKYLYLFMTLWSLTISAQVCSSYIDDFESNRDIVAYATPTDGVLKEKVSNPSPSSTVNNSSLCGLYTPSADMYDNFVLETKAIKNADLFRNGTLKISMQVYGYVANGARIYLRRKGANALTYPAGRHTTLRLSSASGTSVSNAWTTIYFEPEVYTIDNTLPADSIGEIEFQLGGREIYFDNIQIIGGVTTIDDFDSGRNNAIASYTGTLNASFLNTANEYGNSSSKYAVYKKPASGANASIIYKAGELDPRLVANGASLLSINMLSPATAAVRVSLVQTSKYLGGSSTQGIHSVYEGTTKEANKWELVKLAYVANANLTLHPDSVDAIVLQFDPGAQTSVLYKFDNILYSKSQVKYGNTLTTGVACPGVKTYTYSIAPVADDAKYTWTWAPGASIVGDSGTTINVQFINNTPAAKSFKVIAERPGYCNIYSTTVGTVTIGTVPTEAEAGPDFTSCGNDKINLSRTYNGGVSGIWSSTGTGGFAPDARAANAVYTPSAEDLEFGIIQLTLKTSGGNCVPTTDMKTVTIQPKPFIDAPSEIKVCTTATSVTIKATANVGGNINWYGNSSAISPNGAIPSGKDVVFTLPSSFNNEYANETYSLVSDQNYICGYITKNIVIRAAVAGSAACTVTGFTDVSDAVTVAVYPNPSMDGRFKIQSTEEIQEVLLTDMLGRQEKHLSEEFATQLSGILILKIKTIGQKIYTQKVSALSK